MSRLTERVLWMLGAAVTLGLISYLFLVGLDRADKLGSAIGAIVGVVSLLIAAAYRVRSGGAADRAVAKVTNTVNDAQIHGTVIQGGEISGPIMLDGDASHAGDLPPGDRPGG